MKAGDESKIETAYRVETDRLVLRCWSPGDAPVLRAALDACDAHLRPMIPFMKDEPRSLQQTARWLREIRAAFDLGQMFRYVVFDAKEQKLLGENMLRQHLPILLSGMSSGLQHPDRSNRLR